MKDTPTTRKDGGGQRAADGEEAPIISLEEARQRRQRKEATPERDEYEIGRQRHAMQLALLQDLLAEERLEPGDLMDMIKLGLVTDDEALLPCNSRSRSANFFEWEEQYYADEEVRRGPDEDLSDELRELLAERGGDELAEQLRGEARGRTIEANEVCCPLLSYDYQDFPPPCVVAIRSRATDTEWDPQTGRMSIRQLPYDEQDPVVTADLHPCVVLGRELYKTIMVPVWQRKEEKGDTT